ncbi:MAG: O-antigen ligase family protein [Acidaminococcaceae bacterium]
MKKSLFRWQQLNLQQVVFRLLVLLVFVLPLSIPLSGCFFSVTMICALIDQYQRRNQNTKEILPKKLKYGLYALMAISFVSLAFSGNIFASTVNYAYVVGQDIGCFWLVLHYASKKREPLVLLKSFLLSAFIVATYGVFQYIAGTAVLNTEWVDVSQFPELTERVYSTLQNPNILGTFLVVTIGYCIGVFSALPGGKRRIALMTLFLLSTICLLLTFSRGNWVSLFVVLFTYAVFFYRKALWPFLGGGALLAYFAWDLIANRFMSIFLTEDTSVALRFSYVESTIAMIKDSPWGVGWYGYMFAFPDYDFYLQNPNVPMYHCHNLFLNITAELGIQGLVTFLAVTYLLIREAWFLAHADVEPWRKGIGRGYLMVMIGIAVSGLTDYTLFNIQLGMLFWLFNSLLTVCAANARQKVREP